MLINDSEDGNDTIEVLDATVHVNGAKQSSFGVNFQGHQCSEHEFASYFIRQYLNDNMEIVFDEESLSENIRRFKETFGTPYLPDVEIVYECKR